MSLSWPPWSDDGSEVLANVIGCEQRGAAGPAVYEGRLDRLPQVLLRGHVADGVVHEDEIELSIQPDSSHVALHVLAFRIQRLAYFQHSGGRFDEHHAEPRLQM